GGARESGRRRRPLCPRPRRPGLDELRNQSLAALVARRAGAIGRALRPGARQPLKSAQTKTQAGAPPLAAAPSKNPYFQELDRWTKYMQALTRRWRGSSKTAR